MFKIYDHLKKRTDLSDEILTGIVAAAVMLVSTVAGALICMLIMAAAGRFDLADAVSFGAMTGTVLTSLFIMIQLVKYYD